MKCIRKQTFQVVLRPPPCMVWLSIRCVKHLRGGRARAWFLFGGAQAPCYPTPDVLPNCFSTSVSWLGLTMMTYWFQQGKGPRNERSPGNLPWFRSGEESSRIQWQHSAVSCLSTSVISSKNEGTEWWAILFSQTHLKSCLHRGDCWHICDLTFAQACLGNGSDLFDHCFHDHA